MNTHAYTEYLRAAMILFPHAKINLGLNVAARRPDGYHEIQSVLVPIPLNDALEAVVDQGLRPNEIIYTRSGLNIDGSIQNDLCYKAVRLLQEDQELPGIRLHLHKVIPMGAGLGGGSSDGAHTLLLLNRLLKMDRKTTDLHVLAEQLGSDCPFFLENGPQLATGRGARLKQIEVDLKGLWLVLVNPGIHVSTAEAYRNTIPTNEEWAIGSCIARSEISNSNPILRNTMENYAISAHPEIGRLKHDLLRLGARYAAMSGSGSSVFGLFDERPIVPRYPEGYGSWTLPL